jgi:NAD(P)-dependent dehydrogenase (short-subunit alcohol dehydrogenase family)
MNTKTLEGKVAVVAGATRGAGRGIACGLGEAGAIVYCTGRSTRGNLASGPHRPETIEETAEMVTARGGVGIPVRVDHTVPKEVKALFRRVAKEQGRLDVLVNDVWWGGDPLVWGKPFWKLSLENGLVMLERGIHAHIITSYYGVPLMMRRKQGLVVEITDGDGLYYRQDFFVDLCKVAAMRMAWALSLELKRHGITALALSPGYLRSEIMLEYFGVTEENWRDATRKDPNYAESETPFCVGRAVAALAADPNVAAKTGKSLINWDLVEEYGFTDVDGRRPDMRAVYLEHIAKMDRWEVRQG